MSTAGRPPRGWRMPRWLRCAVALLAGLACAVLALAVSPGGPHIVSVVTPRSGQVVGVEGVEVMLRLPEDGRAEPDSLRVLLNGADVTEDLTRARNGAYGRLHGVLDGENVLRIRVEGPSWWLDGRPYAKEREVRFQVRSPQDWNRG
jgi:hypothetical protein